MPEIYLQKISNGLMPYDQQAQDYIEKIGQGKMVKCTITNPRNYLFLKKWFALLNVGFSHWEPVVPDEQRKWGEPQKNFEQFREDVTILCGYYELVTRTNGETRVRAKSVAFGSMDEEDFEKLYNLTLNVLMENLYKDTEIDEARLRDLAKKYEEFA